MKLNRRIFLQLIPAAGAAALAPSVFANAGRVNETDPNALALGYKHDSTQVDKKKFPKHTPDQVCGSCGLYQGKVGSAWGACPALGGKEVAAKGWCAAWVKKA
jgi:hypothetical protein